MGKQKRENVAPKGYVSLLVGKADKAERLLVRAELLNHPDAVSLLEVAAQEFGYQQGGVLRVPCDVERFRRVIVAASRAK